MQLTKHRWERVVEFSATEKANPPATQVGDQVVSGLGIIKVLLVVLLAEVLLVMAVQAVPLEVLVLQGQMVLFQMVLLAALLANQLEAAALLH